MSIGSNSIINADAEARYLSPGELDQIKAFVTGGQRRLRVAQVLCESRERIVKQAGGQLFQKRPDVISPGGNAYGEEMTATCLRDMDYYLRLVTYGIVAGQQTHGNGLHFTHGFSHGLEGGAQGAVELLGADHADLFDRGHVAGHDAVGH